MAGGSVHQDDAPELANAHEIRITSHGKMNAWVEFALKFFEVTSPHHSVALGVL